MPRRRVAKEGGTENGPLEWAEGRLPVTSMRTIWEERWEAKPGRVGPAGEGC